MYAYVRKYSFTRKHVPRNLISFFVSSTWLMQMIPLSILDALMISASCLRAKGLVRLMYLWHIPSLLPVLPLLVKAHPFLTSIQQQLRCWPHEHLEPDQINPFRVSR